MTLFLLLALGNRILLRRLLCRRAALLIDVLLCRSLLPNCVEEFTLCRAVHGCRPLHVLPSVPLFASQRLHVHTPVSSCRQCTRHASSLSAFSICLQRPLRWRRPRRSAHLRPAPTQQWAAASMCTVRSAVPSAVLLARPVARFELRIMRWHGGRYGGHITRLFYHLPEDVQLRLCRRHC